LSKRQQLIDEILGYQFSGWLLAAVILALIVGVRLVFG